MAPCRLMAARQQRGDSFETPRVAVFMLSALTLGSAQS
ncbi:hypothetical protein LINPERHAP2_LOCUS40251 [Linum perenne]